ncbi:MAG: fucose permease [Candidatus Deianiraeaceae bacterium]|jgi:fucose permease
MSQKQLKNTPKSLQNDKVIQLFETAKHIILSLVVICCYIAVGTVIVSYVVHFILPEQYSWLALEQKKMIGDILSGGFIAFLIGKIADKI